MKKLIIIAGLLLFFLQADCALAFQLETIEDTPVKGDFILGPGKVDLLLEPGEKTTQQVTVTNRLGKDMNFKVEVEDFSGSYDTDQTVKLFGEADGPYSMKDYIEPETMEFSLKHGERIVLPVQINIPEDSQPGGLYASVLISTVPDDSEGEMNQGQAKIISRLGTLYFVRVAGEVVESGRLQDFKVADPKNGFYEQGPIPFEVYFENEGNVHMTPSGKIEIKNLLGRRVGEVSIEKYFSMPNSLRKIIVNWDNKVLIGRYTATLTLDKNYQQKPNESETMEVSFWVIPWKILLGVLVAILIFWRLIKYVRGRFKFEIKKK